MLRRFLNNAMIAFAIGTLLGDAILHIMPAMWKVRGAVARPPACLRPSLLAAHVLLSS